jgi:Zn-dependent protease
VFSSQALLQTLLWLPLWILSLSIHEWAHAWSAWKLGDDTAARMGRLTLNPLAHIDIFGTIVLPLLGSPLAWAKPVPVDPTRFRRTISMSSGMAITAAAGPLSNVVQAVVFAVLYGLVARFARGWIPPGSPGRYFFTGMIFVNVSQAVFNMIPVPPLDGSRILAWVIPYRFRDQWHAVEQYAPFLIVGLVLLSSRTGFLQAPIDALADVFFSLVRAIA